MKIIKFLNIDVPTNHQLRKEGGSTIDKRTWEWAMNAMAYIRDETISVFERAILVQFFQNDFLGLDYDSNTTDQAQVNWFNSLDQQKFILNELNSTKP